MKKVRSFVSGLLFLLIGVVIVVFVLNLFVKQQPQPKPQSEKVEEKQAIHLVAIGDSLTKGVGDSQRNGGYVSRIRSKLTTLDTVKNVTTENFGVPGERSDEILDRIKTDSEIKKEVTAADMVILTAGGNDIVQTIKKEKLSVSEKSFDHALEAYRENLKEMLQQISVYNPKAHIYVYGLYNPYAAYFPDLKEMQTLLIEWNTSTETIIKHQPLATFLPIDIIFNGTDRLNNQSTTTDADDAETVVENPYLYEEDLFHPNDAGYEKMAEVLFQAIQKNE